MSGAHGRAESLKTIWSGLPAHMKVQAALLLLLPVNLLLTAAAAANPDAVEAFYSRGLFPAMMQFVSRISGFFPFSLAEVLVITAAGSVIIFAVAAAVQTVRKVRQGERLLKIAADYITRAAAVVLCGIFLFNVMYGFSYYRRNVTENVYDHYMAYTAGDMAWVASYVLDDLNQTRAALGIGDDETFVLTLSRSQLDDAVISAYENLSRDYPEFGGDYSAPKPVALSKPWTYTFVMGMYFPFTGEANYNTNIPGVELPHTILHEMAHQRGVAAEDEANFLAFLASVYSDDLQVRYSGLFESFTFIAAAVRSADPELYELLMERASPGVIADMKAVDEFWAGYSTPLAEVSNDINNAYLESNGQTMGTASYSLSVQYILDYYVNTELSQFIIGGE